MKLCLKIVFLFVYFCYCSLMKISVSIEKEKVHLYRQLLIKEDEAALEIENINDMLDMEEYDNYNDSSHLNYMNGYDLEL
jgi:hypothetical protein